MDTKDILIDNITTNDVQKKQIRILVENKELFPQEIQGRPIIHNLKFAINPNHIFYAQYKIGSKDGRARSGLLKLGDNIYSTILNIKPQTSLCIKKRGDVYWIEKIR